jgi:HNH endonuclease
MSKTYISTALRRLVYDQAQGTCEYCLMPESAGFVAHEVDHMIAEKHGGPTTGENLALACTICNKAKGSDVASIDPMDGEVVRLYRPRTDRWLEHFVLQDGEILPLTPIGQVTVRLLQFNRPGRIEERKLLAAAGVLRVTGVCQLWQQLPDDPDDKSDRPA